MFETSKDILYIVIAFSVLWLTIFTAWGIYYVVMILREAKIMIRDVRKKIEMLEGLIKAGKERLERTSSSMKLLVDAASTVATYAKSKYDEKKSEKKTARRKKK